MATKIQSVETQIKQLDKLFFNNSNYNQLLEIARNIEYMPDDLKPITNSHTKSCETRLDGYEPVHKNYMKKIKWLFYWNRADYVQYYPTENSDKYGKAMATRKGHELELHCKNLTGEECRNYLKSINEDLDPMITKTVKQLAFEIKLTVFQVRVLLAANNLTKYLDTSQTITTIGIEIFLNEYPDLWCRMYSFQHRKMRKNKNAPKPVPVNSKFIKADIMADGDYSGRVISLPYPTKSETMQNLRMELANGDICMVEYPTAACYSTKLYLWTVCGTHLTFRIDNGVVAGFKVDKLNKWYWMK